MKITDIIKEQEVKIPDTEIVVRVREDLGWEEYIALLKVEDDVKRGIEKLARQIVAWNIEAEDGTPLAITPENIAKLPRYVVAPIVARLNAIYAKQTEKKTS